MLSILRKSFRPRIGRIALLAAAFPLTSGVALGQDTATAEEDAQVVQEDSINVQQGAPEDDARTDEETSRTARGTRTRENGQATNVSVVVADEERDDDLAGASLKPHFGSMSVNDDERFTAGLLLETNVTDDPVISVGPEIGVLYTNLTEPGFWEGVFSTGEDFLLMFPVGVQLAWSPRYVRSIKVGVHGTANLVYTRNETEVAGGGEDVSEDFDAFPGFGFDVAFRPSRDFEVSLRPDFTFRPDDNIFTFTIGFGAAI